MEVKMNYDEAMKLVNKWLEKNDEKVAGMMLAAVTEDAGLNSVRRDGELMFAVTDRLIEGYQSGASSIHIGEKSYKI